MSVLKKKKLLTGAIVVTVIISNCMKYVHNAVVAEPCS